ncbi:Uncharacterized protein Rs2_40184 [Raphanus sativus]|nr:Uncharacterized protein Rs2_40184 [Raphanus sativus]
MHLSLIFSSSLSPSRNLTITSSRHHTITSAQAHRHTVTLTLLKLTVTPLSHVCYRLPSPHICYSIAFISVNGEEEDPRFYKEGRRTKGERRNKKMREDDDEKEKNRGYQRRRRKLAVEDDERVVRLFTDCILNY